MNVSPKVILVPASESHEGTPFSTPMEEAIRIVVGDRRLNLTYLPPLPKVERTHLPGLPNLSRLAPKLRELFLWNIDGLTRAGELPRSLIALEIAGAPDLTRIELPRCSLLRLMLIDCPKLESISIPEGSHWTGMEELILRGCSQLPSRTISSLMAAAPNLLELDLSGCEQANPLVGSLPPRLERLRLDGCRHQERLPHGLPSTLKYLSLQHCTALTQVPPLPASCDYCDLTGTRQLKVLPKFPRPSRTEMAMEERLPRSLFLFGSGILEPPASEHGRTAQSNVAEATHAYQNDCELAGEGKAMRCKLLLLGNSTAGKTEFAHQLLGRRRNNSDSTHGVQLFTDPRFMAGVDHVHLHVWDFGGQEIYHNTHRHFASRGSVFVILWDPQQDGQQPAAGTSGLQDRYYPVRYWLDYIVAACPHLSPSIAIVCNCKDPGQAIDPDWTHRMRERLARHVGDTYWKQIEDGQIGFFCADVRGKRGEWADLTGKWLPESVRSVLVHQGFVVPSYWELAQERIKPWLPESGVTASVSADPSMPRDEFAEKLREYIGERLGGGVLLGVEGNANIANPTLDLEALKGVWDGGAFLNAERIHRTLRFLTHLGWIYWDPQLHDGQIILDQRWALDAIYETLRHDPGAGMYCQLKAVDGVLDFGMVWEQVWKHWPDESPERLRLLWSFMQTLGVVIPLGRSWRYGGETESKFLSPEHLPETGPAYARFLEKHFASSSVTPNVVAESLQLHRGHWLDMVRVFAANHGTDAEYTQHGVWLRGSQRFGADAAKDAWNAWIQFEPVDYRKPKAPMAAKITAHFVGASEEQQKRIEDLIHSQCPGYAGNASDQVEAYRAMVRARAPRGPTVFISYAHDPAKKEGYYTEPVDAVCEMLRPYEEKRQCMVIRDKVSMQEHDSILRFMSDGVHVRSDHYVVFLSEKYWTGWYTMLELLWIRESMLQSTRNTKDSLSWIAHPDKRIAKPADAKWLKEHWESRQKECDEGVMPNDMPGPMNRLNWRELPKRFLEVVDWYVTDVRDTISVTRTWPVIPESTSGKQNEDLAKEREDLLAWVRCQLRLDANVVD